jgi:hypothetical protein
MLCCIPLVFTTALLDKIRNLEVQRRIFGQKKEEITGGSRKCPNEKLHNLYSSPHIT